MVVEKQFSPDFIKKNPYTAISTDSRSVPPGALFVALRGENFDGHDFLNQAVERGASALLIQKNHQLPGDLPKPDKLVIYRVKDTLEALRQTAGVWREQFQIPILAIGGSVGKTTSKEILAAILTGRYQQILKTSGSQNGFLGIPLTLLNLKTSHEVAVIEIGIDAPDAMQDHVHLVKPTASLITKIAPEHMELLHDMDTVAKEECHLLIETEKLGGTCAINLDDPWIRKYFLPREKHKHVTYSLDPNNPDVPVRGMLSKDGKWLNIQMSLNHDFKLPMLHEGRHNAANLLGAVTLALTLGLRPEEIMRGWQSYQALQNRSRVIRVANGPTIIRDEYNASPASVEAALELMSTVAQATGKRIVCLGDMLELGEQEEAYHRGLSESVLASGATHVFSLGHRAAWLISELKDKSTELSLSSHDDHKSLAEEILQILEPGDTLLIKGSRSMHMEKILPFLSTKWLLP